MRDARELPRVSNWKRLVPSSFSYGEAEIIRDVVRNQLNKRRRSFHDYPRTRLKLKLGEYDELVATGGLITKLIGTPENRPKWFIDGKDRRNANGQLAPQAQDVSNLRPEDHVPLHPYIRELLTNSKSPGVLSGPGFYWHLGPQTTFDPVILREHKGKLQILLVKGKDRRGWVLPGGHKEGNEIALVGAAREGIEETGISVEAAKKVLVRGLQHIPVGEWRVTANAWPVTDVVMYDLGKSDGQKPKPRDRDEVKKAAWKNVSRRTLRSMSFSHPNFVRVAVQEWEQANQRVVRRDSRIGIAKVA